MWDRSWEVRKWREWSSEQSATISWLTDSPSSRSCRSMLSMRKPDCSTAWRYTGGFLEWMRRKSEEMPAMPVKPTRSTAGKRDTDFVCKERSSGAREEKEWYHPQRIGEGEGDKDEGFVRNAEGTLWLEMNQGRGLQLWRKMKKSDSKWIRWYKKWWVQTEKYRDCLPNYS